MMGSRRSGWVAFRSCKDRPVQYLQECESATHPFYDHLIMRRKLLVLALGIVFLIVMAWAGTVLTEILPARATAQTQSVQAGAYKITLRVDPNPPSVSRPATLTFQIVHNASLVTNARVTVVSSMDTMDMGTDRAVAHVQSNGLYSVPVQFLMSGTWQVQVLIFITGAQTESATFEVTAH
jgi:YtkA-like